MTLGDIIFQYRTKHGLSQRKFAEISGLSNGYISILEKNQTPRGDEPVPTLDTYRKVAAALSIDIDALIRMVDGKVSLANTIPDADNIFPLPAMKEWPVLGAVACGEPIHRELERETVLAPADVKADFVFRCDGDSMIGAHIFEGDAVFVKFGDVADGEIGVVRVGEEYTLKRIYRGNDYLELRSENPAYSPKIIRGEQIDAEIVGKAVYFLSRVI